jgi:hypothetical protein
MPEPHFGAELGGGLADDFKATSQGIANIESLAKSDRLRPPTKVKASVTASCI